MAIIGIIGDTGYGKTMSIVVPPDGIIKKDSYEGLNPKSMVIFNLDKKELPFNVYIKKFPAWKEAFGDFMEKRVLTPNADKFIPMLNIIGLKTMDSIIEHEKGFLMLNLITSPASTSYETWAVNRRAYEVLYNTIRY